MYMMKLVRTTVLGMCVAHSLAMWHFQLQFQGHYTNIFNSLPPVM